MRHSRTYRLLSLVLVVSVAWAVIGCAEEVNPTVGIPTETALPIVEHESTTISEHTEEGSSTEIGATQDTTIIRAIGNWPEALPEAIGRLYAPSEATVIEVLFNAETPDVWGADEVVIYESEETNVSIMSGSLSGFEFTVNSVIREDFGKLFPSSGSYTSQTEYTQRSEFGTSSELSFLSKTTAQQTLFDTLDALGFTDIDVRDVITIKASTLNEKAAEQQAIADSFPLPENAPPDLEPIKYKQDWLEDDGQYFFYLLNIGPHDIPVYDRMDTSLQRNSQIDGSQLVGSVGLDGVLQLSFMNYYAFLEEDNNVEMKPILSESEMDVRLHDYFDQLIGLQKPEVFSKMLMYYPTPRALGDPYPDQIRFAPVCVVTLLQPFEKDYGILGEAYTELVTLIFDAYTGDVIYNQR